MNSPSAHQARLIVTVTPNPALDVTYHVNGIHLGQTHRVSPPLERAGGKGLNVARVAHQMGHPALAVAPAGGASGTVFRTELEASGVPHRLIPVTANTRRSIAFVDTARDMTSIFNEHGLPLLLSEWQSLAAAVAETLDGSPDGTAPRCAVLVGSGSLPAHAPEDFYPELVRLAHRHGIPAIIDTSGRGILDAARAGADLLKPNHQELMDATGEMDLHRAARHILDLGARTVLVSAGAEGMYAFTAQAPDIHWRARLPQPLTGNPTGAGDAAVAAAAVALASGESHPEAILRAATAWSAAAVLMPAAGEISPRHAEVARQLIVTREENRP
ncbi:1-phosphofructokinase family hexose kinase [Pseudarthrobacter sp. S9]|uniref:1-phosphofructokinase family hexose kinase n=1 Tax=Pseudarthrobacter sp. S9 TaxID=3418421 RepID=UPI003CFCF660